ncbi:MAG: RNA polymerase subunit sigma-70, partial [Anaerolineae bacterium]|nr:RNA polymerase subunit sigma-70 [Anaerolineae bacterium]
MEPTTQVTDLVIRQSYGRLVAYLASRWGDLMAAEDALSEALLAALNQWPHQGIPDNPEGWLLTVAKRRLLDLTR